jgi:hypothetical protein
VDRIHIGEDNVVEWLRLRNNITEAYVNTATVRATLKDSTGEIIAGAWAVVLSYVAGSNGDYRGTISAAATSGLTDGGTYYLEVTATGDGTGFRRMQVTATYHGAQ